MNTRKVSALTSLGEEVIVNCLNTTDEDLIRLGAFRPLTDKVSTSMGVFYETKDVYFRNLRDAHDYGYFLARCRKEGIQI